MGIIISSSAQRYDLDVDSIPALLKKNADVVVRKYEKILEVKSPDSAIEKVTEVVTIMNPDGDFYSYLVAQYDKFSSISRIEAVIYDAKGNKIKEIDDEIKDISATDGFTIYSDSRVKLYKPNVVHYPYTVYYKFKRKINSILYWPDWRPIRNGNVSVEENIYKIVTPKGFNYFVKEKNLNGKPELIEEDDRNIRTYTLNNYTAFKPESYGAKVEDFVPTVIISPEKFNYGGYDGSYNSWQSFGQFIHEINSNRDELSDELKIKLKELTSDLKTDEDKAKVIYEFMQNNTRYVSIQYGIGGHQPMLALEVERNGYGDCKALSNYTYSMLNYVGVEAKYSLIKAGDDGGDFNEDIVYSPFNHAILCLPNKGDTLWLECTSQKAPFGFLGDFTGNRKALIITPEGGKLANTTKYTENENVKSRDIIVDIDEKGNAIIELKQQNNGVFYNDLAKLDETTLEEQKKYLYNNLSLKNLNIESIDIDLQKEILPTSSMDMRFELSNYAKVSNNRLFLPLNMFYNGYRLKKNKEERKGKIRNKFAFVVNDSIIYNIPDGYVVESTPKTLNINNEFGAFKTSVIFKNNQIIYYREYLLKEGEFSADKFDEFYKFKLKKQKADRAKIVLIKKI